MEPRYVTFEQAKWLKEIGFNVDTDTCFHALLKHIIEAPMSWDNDRGYLVRPEQHQVVEWLRINHGIWVEVGVGNLFHKDKFYILIKKYNVDRWDLTSLDNKTHSPYDLPQEAYSAAFDYIKDNNLI